MSDQLLLFRQRLEKLDDLDTDMRGVIEGIDPKDSSDPETDLMRLRQIKQSMKGTMEQVDSLIETFENGEEDNDDDDEDDGEEDE